jgi:hypothetical protein
VARKGTAQYAFYRGHTALGPPPAATPAQQPNAAAEPFGANGNTAPSLLENLKSLNTSNQARQIERLQNRYAAPAPSAPSGAAAGGFK